MNELIDQSPLCLNAHNFTGSWRRDYFGEALTPIGGFTNCDTNTLASLGNPWFRFTGDAGTRLLDSCGSCGTHGAIWSDERVPTPISLVKKITVYSSWVGGCKDTQYSMFVMRCSSNDVIYKFNSTAPCNIGFCSMY